MKFLKLTLVVTLFAISAAIGQEKPKPLTEPGVYLGGSWSQGSKIDLVPQVWFSLYDFYIEGRYNYEDEKTYSFHLGRPFEIEELKMEVIPMVGLIFGNFNGYSLGLNTEVDEEKIAIASENQYCFSSVNTNFFFSWLKATTPIVKNFHLGGSWQYTLDPSSSVFDAGPMAAFKKGIFELEFFAYNAWKDSRYWQVGVSLQF